MFKPKYGWKSGTYLRVIKNYFILPYLYKSDMKLTHLKKCAKVEGL